jgi:hypothetical protein
MAALTPRLLSPSKRLQCSDYRWHSYIRFRYNSPWHLTRISHMNGKLPPPFRPGTVYSYYTDNVGGSGVEIYCLGM